MPELDEQMYCSQQIIIPPSFPYILKKYAKAAIKTQPYDLLRWSFEYFNALAENKIPPVKLRLEYPVFNTEGGLTRGYLKVLSKQLAGMDMIPLSVLRSKWAGSCLDPNELNVILCLCEVYMKEIAVPRLNFLAVAGGLLTKSLTNTMILLCETLTKEPDGGSAAIPIEDFLKMYKFLAAIDASKDVIYSNGYREGQHPPNTVTSEAVNEETLNENTELVSSFVSDEFWEEPNALHTVSLINDIVSRSNRLSVRLNQPILGTLERAPSVERASKIERANFFNENKGVNNLYGDYEDSLLSKSDESQKEDDEDADKLEDKEEIFVITIRAFDENDEEIPYEIYGEPPEPRDDELLGEIMEGEAEEEQEKISQEQRVSEYVASINLEREQRLVDLQNTFEELDQIVDKYNTANYDLGVIAGRQMSSTSGEFIAQYIEKDVMDYINEQIAILPDPDLKKKKAKPEEVEMVRELVHAFIKENIEVLIPEIEEAEEEEIPIPEILTAYAVPGIGPTVEEDIQKKFIEYALEVCKTQAELFMPRNVRHFMCPPLEKYDWKEYVHETVNDKPEKEEVPKEAAITD